MPLQRQEVPNFNTAPGGGGTLTQGLEGEEGDMEGQIRQAFSPEADAGATPSDDPPHELVNASDRSTNKVSNAVVDDLSAVVSQVQELTGQDMGTDFGDTTRRLASTTTKDGADNFSWHKTGRAVDFNQDLPWVIVEDPSGGDMYFRLYLKATDQEQPAVEEGAEAPEGETTTAEGQTTAESAEEAEGTGTTEEAGEWQHPSEYAKKFTREADQDSIHYNALGNRLWNSWMIDVTSILEANGYERIPAHSGWESRYNHREWWHYVNDDGLSWYEALAEIYSRDDIVSGVQTFATNRHSHGGRLSREGFPDDVLKDVWGNTPVTRNGFGLHFSVGSDRNCANIADDVAAVREALTTLGVAPQTNIADMITAFQAQQGFNNPDGFITVGGGTHGRIGQRLQERQ